MKILIIQAEGMLPLRIRPDHVEKIQAVDERLRVSVVSENDQAQLDAQLQDCDILAGVPHTLPPLFHTKNLKWVHAFSAGVEWLLTPEIVHSSLLVSNSAGIHATPIGEHVLGFMLLFTRKFAVTFRNQQKKVWEKQQDLSELQNKTVLVVGLGHIGEEVARLAHCFGTKVLAVDRKGKEKPSFVEELGTQEQLPFLLPQADFVVLCLPYTKDTHHLFRKEQLHLMKSSAVLINIGRGGVIHEQELIDALQNKVIGGAALDVTETEPLPSESPLWNMENVVITPHHSGWSEKYMDRAIDLFCENLKAFLEQRPLPNLVDKTAGY